jgi:hypothetical protein
MSSDLYSHFKQEKRTLGRSVTSSSLNENDITGGFDENDILN